jgi:hypothetical protein
VLTGMAMRHDGSLEGLAVEVRGLVRLTDRVEHRLRKLEAWLEPNTRLPWWHAWTLRRKHASFCATTMFVRIRQQETRLQASALMCASRWPRSSVPPFLR